MMHSAKGSISLPCLLAALLLALSAQLCLLYAVKGYEAEKDFLRGQQLRLLCGLHRLLQFKALIQQIIAAVKALYRCRQQHCRKAEAHQLLYQAKASAIFHKQSPCL